MDDTGKRCGGCHWEWHGYCQSPEVAARRTQESGGRVYYLGVAQDGRPAYAGCWLPKEPPREAAGPRSGQIGRPTEPDVGKPDALGAVEASAAGVLARAKARAAMEEARGAGEGRDG